MAKIKAYMNHGRWLWRCPDCGGANRVDFSDDVCMHCYPEVLATGNRIKPGQEDKLLAFLQGDLRAMRNLIFEPAADQDARQRARERAHGRRKAHQVELPPRQEREQVEALLRKRPKPLMNYHPERGEKLADLKRENKELGIQ